MNRRILYARFECTISFLNGQLLLEGSYKAMTLVTIHGGM